MITRDNITEVGAFNKPHGVNGEISSTFECQIEDVKDFSCIIVDIDGIFVPFYINNIRYKNNTTFLLKLDEVETEEGVKAFVGKPIYALKTEIEDIEPEDNDSYYFIGFSIKDYHKGDIGTIIDVDDSTDNYLFVVSSKDKEVLVPVAEEYIMKIDDKKKIITMLLPEGILDL
ncbi:MAG: ribosome maturation factor RimM [Muribaculaceae bacterium]|nr:ribosome maturation factor RimM [Muribaculaceae bacterium]